MAQTTKSWRPSLLTAAWRSFTIDGEHYLVKSVVLDTSYDVAVTDLVHIWLEHIDLDDFVARSKVLNPNVDAPPSRLFRQIATYLQQQKDDAEYSLIKVDDDDTPGQLIFKLQTKISSLIHKWEFHLKPGSTSEMSEHLVRPVITTTAELARRLVELQLLLKKKDKEIAEYKSNSVKLSRRHLETAVFDVKTFTSEMLVSEAFNNMVKSPAATNFQSVQNVYEQVMEQRCKQDKEQDDDFVDSGLFGDYTQQLPSSLVPAGFGPSTGSHTYNLPASLIPQSIGEPVAKRPYARTPPTSPSKSPAKSISPIKSPEPPSQDMELMRRQEIAKRLNAEAEKKKTKKKKITKL